MRDINLETAQYEAAQLYVKAVTIKGIGFHLTANKIAMCAYDLYIHAAILRGMKKQNDEAAILYLNAALIGYDFSLDASYTSLPLQSARIFAVEAYTIKRIEEAEKLVAAANTKN